MHRSIRSAVVSACLVVSLAACGGGKGPSDAEVEKRVTTEMKAQGLSSAQATCFAKAVIKAVGVEQVKDVPFDSVAPTPAMSKKIATAAQAALSSCKIDVSTIKR